MQFVYIAIFAVAVILAGIAAWLFHKKKLPKWALLTLVPSFFGAAVCLTAVIFILSPPEVRLLGNCEVTVPVFSHYEDEGAAAYRGIKNITEQISVSDNADYSTVGEYEIVYSVKAGRAYSQAVRHIRVVDDSPPVITLNGGDGMVVTDMSAFSDPGFTAADNYDGDLTDRVQVVSRRKSNTECEVVYTVADKSGNRTSVIRKVTVNDTLPPVITVNSEKETYVVLNGQYTEQGAEVTDNYDGDITAKLTISGSVDTSRLGTYDIKYTATDSSGNSAYAFRRVNVITDANAINNKIYLTFDDGPSGNVTERVLDVLKENNIKATFFIIDYSADKLPLIRRMIDEGHTIGIHGYSHDYKVIYESDDAFISNINTLRDKLKSDTGYTATVMRFPGGSSNVVSKRYNKGIMTRLVKRVTDEGWRYFDWNIDSTDAEGTKTAEEIFSTVTCNLKKNRSNMVLMHDSEIKPTTADALQSIIDYGRDNGYMFCAIDERTVDIKHPISN